MGGRRFTDEPGRGLRAAVLGGGMIGTAHAESARRAGATVAAAVGSTSARGGVAAEATGAERSAADIDELLREVRPDVVHVCTPNVTHPGLARACLESGAHVMCEKPRAPTAEDAVWLTELVEASGRVCTVPFVYRLHPMAREMRARVAEGEPGVIAAVHGGYLQDWMSRARDDNWRAQPEQAGESQTFADIGSHWCDFLEFVLGDRIATVSAGAATTHPRRGPDARAVSTE